jgi:hypothetical protein
MADTKTSDGYKNPVYEFIETEAENYRHSTVPLTDNWAWSMFEHVRRSFLYKNSKFSEGENDDSRPFKNITLPILRVAYRSEGFDVKDIVPYVDDADAYDKSFFVKKFWERWAEKNKIDTFIDEFVEQVVDYGLTLVERMKGKRPEVVPLQTIAFCDQTDILSGPICTKMDMTVDDLYAMKGKWSQEAIDLAIEKCRNGKTVLLSEPQEAKTPGKYAEVYKLRGLFPKEWLDTYEGEEGYDAEGDNEYDSDDDYVKAVFYCAYYYDSDGEKQGITFFKGPEKKEVYKAHKRDAIFGRACGVGGVEELFNPQQWANFNEIQLQEMLQLASLMLVQVQEGSGKTRNVLTELEKGQVLEYGESKYEQLQLQPVSKELFDQAVDRWEKAARNIGSADEALLGEAPAAGTPFSLQALVVQQGFGLHDYRKGQNAAFMAEILEDWLIQDLLADMKSGSKWLATLSLDEMQGMVDNVVNIQTKRMVIDHLVKGQLPTQDQIDQYKQDARTLFMKDSKKFLELMDGELDDLPISVMWDVAGKQKDLKGDADKLTNIFRQIIQSPQVFQIPGMAKLFNEIIEASGFSPVDFSGMTNVQPQAAPQAAPGAPVPPTPSPLNVGPQPVITPSQPVPAA